LPCTHFREQLQKALFDKFGSDVDASGSKAFKIHSSSYRVDADVTPFVVAKHESDPYENGMCFNDTKGVFFVNYPDQNLS